MICGALQTLNEEACEDVLEESGEVGEFSSKKEKLVNAVEYKPHAELTTSKSMIYLKNFDKDAKTFESSSNFDVNRHLRESIDQNENNDFEESENSSFTSRERIRGFSSSALYVKYRQKQADPEPGPSTSKDTHHSHVPYKDNVAHVQTQTTTRLSEKRGNNITFPKPPPTNNGSKSNSSRSSSLPPPSSPSNKEKKPPENSERHKEQNDKNEDVTDSEVILKSEASTPIKKINIFTL